MPNPTALPALLTAAGLLCLQPARAMEPGDLERTAFGDASYARARVALIESIEEAGLVVSTISDFGQMLARTDADLHHGADRYAHAEVFSFCSVRVAARLVKEDIGRIADCPLKIALYQGREPASPVCAAFRAPPGESGGAQAGSELLRGILDRTREQFRPAAREEPPGC